MKQKKMKVLYRNNVPMIQMSGKWLSDLGFHIGDTFALEYDETGIRIRPLTEEELAEQSRKEIEANIRRKQKELKALQKQVEHDLRSVGMVAEPKHSSYKVSSIK
ncbi:MAG: hypothetical protein ACI4ET_05800 [Bilifractor sp.]